MFDQYSDEISAYLQELAAAYIGKIYSYRVFCNIALQYILLEVHLPEPYNPFGAAPVRIIVWFIDDSVEVSIATPNSEDRFPVGSMEELGAALESWMPQVRADLDDLLARWQAGEEGAED